MRSVLRQKYDANISYRNPVTNYIIYFVVTVLLSQKLLLVDYDAVGTSLVFSLRKVIKLDDLVKSSQIMAIILPHVMVAPKANDIM